MNYQNLRISKLRDYLFNIINEIKQNEIYQINANMLSNEPINYSLDKIPTESKIEKWIFGIEIHRDVYSFRSRMEYSQDTINNLKNIGFFEEFENKIKENNENKILPDIEGIEKVECLNCGTMNYAETKTAEFDIQLQITYRVNKNDKKISL